MAIRRACSYAATITTPEAPGEYSAILVSFAQNGQNLVNLDQDSPALIIESDSVTARLTQEQTKQFTAGEPAFLQIRAYKSAYDAPGSKVWAIDVYDSLNTEVLS